MTAAPKVWTQLIAEVLQEAKIIPLCGSPPEFPWARFSEELGKKWNLPGLQIKCVKTSWYGKEASLQGLGVNPIITPISVSPLEGGIYLAVSDEDMQLLTQTTLQPSSVKEPISPTLAKGYYQFLLLQALKTIKENQTYPNLAFRIAETAELEDGPFMVAEITLDFGKGRIYSKLLFSKPFLSDTRNFFRVDSSAFMRTPEASQLPLSLRIVVGRSKLNLSEWKQASVGDFLRLDRCTLSKKKDKGVSGKALIALYETPLFDAAIKDGKVSLLDYAFYQEESDMQDDPIDEEQPNKGEGEEEFLPEEEMGDEVGDEEFEEAPLEEAEAPEEKALPQEPPPPGSEDLMNVVATSEIPITLAVEIGRLRMNLDKLLQLQPGNVLELAEHAGAEVSLFANGKCVATGELVALGEIVGVKITKIGH